MLPLFLSDQGPRTGRRSRNKPPRFPDGQPHAVGSLVDGLGVGIERLADRNQRSRLNRLRSRQVTLAEGKGLPQPVALGLSGIVGSQRCGELGKGHRYAATTAARSRLAAAALSGT